jgi:dTDP-4-dehydrorhamnose reductase
MEPVPVHEAALLVTGGSGCLGEACRRVFPEAMFPPRSDLDLTVPASIERFFALHAVERVVHLAAVASVTEAARDPRKAYAVNVHGTRHLAAAARRSGVRHFLQMSTACVFSGDPAAPAMPDENTPPNPRNYYSLSKYAAEEVARSAAGDGMRVTVVRSNFAPMPWRYPRAFTDRFGTYLFAGGVASGLRDILLDPPESPIIHLCGDQRLSMYDYARLGGSEVKPMGLADYQGPDLTVDMSIITRCWHRYRLTDHAP